MAPPLQAEAKAAAEQQARLRAEEEARKAAQQKAGLLHRLAQPQRMWLAASLVSG